MIGKYSAIAVLVLVLVGATWWFASFRAEAPVEAEKSDSMPMIPASDTSADPQPGAAIGDENMVVFACDGGETMTAVFESDIVGLTLSDGRQIVLREAPTASGVRYLSNDTRIELSSKGTGAILRENGETTYDNCVAGE